MNRYIAIVERIDEAAEAMDPRAIEAIHIGEAVRHAVDIAWQKHGWGESEVVVTVYMDPAWLSERLAERFGVRGSGATP